MAAEGRKVFDVRAESFCVCLSLVPSGTGRDKERYRSHGDYSGNMKRETQLFFCAL